MEIHELRILRISREFGVVRIRLDSIDEMWTSLLGAHIHEKRIEIRGKNRMNKL
jgi:hypothetical protein